MHKEDRRVETQYCCDCKNHKRGNTYVLDKCKATGESCWKIRHGKGGAYIKFTCDMFKRNPRTA